MAGGNDGDPSSDRQDLSANRDGQNDQEEISFEYGTVINVLINRRNDLPNGPRELPLSVACRRPSCK